MNRRMLMKGGVLAAAMGSMLAAGSAMAADVSLRMATWLPPKHHLIADTLPVWIKAIEEASGGSLTIAIDPAPIAKPPAQYDIVRDGAADMSYHVMAYTPGPFEIIRGVEVPFLSPNAEVGSKAAYDWYERNIGFDKEFSDVKIVTIFVHGPGAVHSKFPIQTLEDMQNVKLRVGGGGVRMAEALGATPVAMPAPAAYEAIQKGVTDGAMFPFESIKGFRLGELVDHHLVIPGGLYTTAFAIVMNRAKWDGLSDEHKKVLTDLGGVTGAGIIGAGWDRADAVGLEEAAKDNGSVVTLSDAEMKRWAEKVDFMNGDWVKRANDAGLDGQALLDDLRATVDKYANE